MAATRYGWVCLLLLMVACPSGEKPKKESKAAPVQVKPPPGPPKRLFASRYVVTVYSAPSKQARRLGYMRAGVTQMATTAEPVGFEQCRRGWFKLANMDGYVCGTKDVIAFYGDRLPEQRPAQPDFTKPLPYVYAHTMRGGTPMYKRLPSSADLAALAAAPPLTTSAPTAPAVSASDEGAAESAPAQVAAQPADVAAPSAPTQAPIEQGNAGAGPPTLASLKGAKDTPIMRYLERGFLLSLDREMERDGRKYWRTMSNGYVPQGSLYLLSGSGFHGFTIAAPATLPVAFVRTPDLSAYTLDDKGRLRAVAKLEFRTGFVITRSETLKQRAYVIDDQGRYIPESGVLRVEPATMPKDLGDKEKWIDIDLAKQTLVAYEGAQPVYATLVSTGKIKKKDDPLLDHETPTGAFRISSKHVTHTMDGDHAVDGPYSIEDVPYVMYFQLAYALHSAFWHDRFGKPKSHGCINMAPLDAKWLFNWVTPVLPTGWHGVYAPENTGTRVVIHGETPERG